MRKKYGRRLLVLGVAIVALSFTACGQSGKGSSPEVVETTTVGEVETATKEEIKKVPHLRGCLKDEAIEKLEELGIKYEIEEVFEGIHEDGMVLIQKPSPSTIVTKDTVVNLKVHSYVKQKVSDVYKVERERLKYKIMYSEGEKNINYIDNYEEIISDEFKEVSFKKGDIIDCKELINESGRGPEYDIVYRIQFTFYEDCTRKQSGWLNPVVKQKANDQLELIEGECERYKGALLYDLSEEKNIVYKCIEDVTIRTWIEDEYICYEVVDGGSEE